MLIKAKFRIQNPQQKYTFKITIMQNKPRIVCGKHFLNKAVLHHVNILVNYLLSTLLGVGCQNVELDWNT